MKFLPTTIFVMQTIHVKNQTCTYICRVHVIWISYMAKTKVHHQLLAFSTTLCQMCFTFYKILLIFTIIKRGRTKNKNINAINPLIITLWSKWQLLVIKLKSKFFVKKKMKAGRKNNDSSCSISAAEVWVRRIKSVVWL